MAEGKTSFTAYCDWIDTFNELSDEEAGKLIKHTLRYVNDLDPVEPDRVTKLLFAPIKATLKRDLKKWLNKQEINKKNGSLGGRPKKTEENPEKPNGFKENPNNPQKGVSVSVRDSVRDSNNTTDSQPTVESTFELFWNHFHNVTGKKKESKKPALKHWKKLSLEERRKAYKMVEPYSKTNESKYLKIARTYLSDEAFEDELLPVDQPLKETEEDRKLKVINRLTHDQACGYEPVKVDKYPYYNGMFFNVKTQDFQKEQP